MEVAKTTLARAILDVINLQIDRRNRSLIGSGKIGVDVTAYNQKITIDAFLPMEDILCDGNWDIVCAAVELLQQNSAQFRENFAVEERETRCMHIQVRGGVILKEDVGRDWPDYQPAVPRMVLEGLV